MMKLKNLNFLLSSFLFVAPLYAMEDPDDLDDAAASKSTVVAAAAEDLPKTFLSLTGLLEADKTPSLRKGTLAYLQNLSYWYGHDPVSGQAVIVCHATRNVILTTY